MFDVGAKLWVGALILIALLVVLTVNFGFRESWLKEELIEHTAVREGTRGICICPQCNKRGLAYCMHCGGPMDWVGSGKHFACSSCGRVGQPHCSACGTLMSGIAPAGNRQLATGSAIPVF